MKVLPLATQLWMPRRAVAGVAAVVSVTTLLALPTAAAPETSERGDLCNSLLPTTPVVIRPTDSTISFPLRTEHLYGFVTATLTLPDIDVSAQGEIRDSGLRFPLPASQLPKHESLTYIVEVVTEAQVCSTSEWPLSFVVSPLSPDAALGLSLQERRAFHEAASRSFSRAALLAGLLDAPGGIHDLRKACAELFEEPTPCDWAPGEGNVVAGGDVPGSEPDQGLGIGARDSGGLASLSQGCRTIRLRNVSSDSSFWHWGRFKIERPSSGAPFTLHNAQANKTNASQNRINLFSDVTRAVQGGANVFTFGNVGFFAKITPIPLTDPITITPFINYTLDGNGSAQAVAVFPIGSGTGETRVEIAPESGNLNTGGQTQGSKVFDEGASATPSAVGVGTTSKTYARTQTVGGPSLTDVRDGHTVTFHVRGKASALAEAIGTAGTRGLTDVREAGDFLQANFVDMQLQDPRIGWIDTSRCVEFW